jgi:succinate dehydrogenase flavin-adding protein (antitoxin of CptAB toxin-antitoxin module)
MEGKVTDKYVQSVKDKFEKRSQIGIQKYNTTLERDDLSLLDWINHAQEEAMDLTLYLERIKSDIEKLVNKK